MVGPWILFAPLVVDVTSDLQFIQDRVDAGEWLETHGAINAVTNEIAIIPASGKTFYAFRGRIQLTSDISITIINGTSTDINKVSAQAKVDGTIKDECRVGSKITNSGDSSSKLQGAAGESSPSQAEFHVLGLSLVGDGIKKVTIENSSDNGSADATLSGWIKTT